MGHKAEFGFEIRGHSAEFGLAVLASAKDLPRALAAAQSLSVCTKLFFTCVNSSPL
jgi:hypothetical protein